MNRIGRRVIVAALLLLAAGKTDAGSAEGSGTLVPVVGCASDGQVGPIEAPRTSFRKVDFDPAIARRLAWYRAEGSEAVLAPRGWTCFNRYGSGGDSLAIGYPADQMHPRRKDLVEFETPGDADGLGTAGSLRKSADPVVGAVRFEERDDNSVSLLRIRLPLELRALAPTIFAAFAKERGAHRAD